MSKFAGVLPLFAGLGVLCGAPLAFAQEMQFRVAPIGVERGCGSRCPKAIVAEGQISHETARAFVEFFRNNVRQPRLVNMLLIHSPGGTLYGGLELGAVLRRLGTTVVVARAGETPTGLLNGACYSACVYSLMGGIDAWSVAVDPGVPRY